MNIIEDFLTIQGEGKYTGKPSLFLRTTGCNLRCAWENKDGTINKCDTPYSSWTPEKGKNMNLDEIVALADKYKKDNKFNHIVITGGEPTLQRDIVEVCNGLVDRSYIVTLETNGTLLTEDKVSQYSPEVLLSISPKLRTANATNNVMHKNNNKFVDNLKYVQYNHINKQYKFVVNNESDFDEVLAIQKEADLDDIYIMPQALVDSEQQEKQEWVVKNCLKHDFTYCTRLHVNIWGDQRGK